MLISCMDCGKQISHSASECPNCGGQNNFASRLRDSNTSTELLREVARTHDEYDCKQILDNLNAPADVLEEIYTRFFVADKENSSSRLGPGYYERKKIVNHPNAPAIAVQAWKIEQEELRKWSEKYNEDKAEKARKGSVFYWTFHGGIMAALLYAWSKSPDTLGIPIGAVILAIFAVVERPKDS